MNPGSIPDIWPNGSGLYRQGTAHLKSDKGLLGRSFREGDKIKAWKYMGNGKYFYLGTFPDDSTARQRITGR